MILMTVGQGGAPMLGDGHGGAAPGCSLGSRRAEPALDYLCETVADSGKNSAWQRSPAGMRWSWFGISILTPKEGFTKRFSGLN